MQNSPTPDTVSDTSYNRNDGRTSRSYAFSGVQASPGSITEVLLFRVGGDLQLAVGKTRVASGDFQPRPFPPFVLSAVGVFALPFGTKSFVKFH